MPLSPGTRLDAYELIRPLGSGGMGEVWLARDSRLNRDVAIKVLPADRVCDEDRRRRFVQEAQAASALNHPHIITIYEIEEDQGIDFIAMEYLRGKSLDALIPRQGLRVGETLRISIAVADALAAAHARGIVHRDLKPANVMVGTDGVVKVVDFGLAKLVARDDDSTSPESETRTTVAAHVSTPGTIAGTAAYMSPEQALGEKVDARSDIFSFGAVLYEMTTGVRPFGGASAAETLSAVIRAQPTPPTEVIAALPRELERLILRCLRKDADRRYQTMRDVSLELQEIKEESDSGRLASAIPSDDQRRRTRLIPVTVAAAVVVVAAIGIIWRLTRKSEPAAPPQRLVPLTALKGLEWEPTLSPDGEQVAFQWNGEKEDNDDIYLKLVGSSELRRLTTDASEDSTPAWSPDGREIAFLRRGKDRTTLHAVSPITGAERKIADLGSGYGLGLCWSPDGRWLASGHVIPGQSSSLQLVPVQGGPSRTLTTAQHPAGLFVPSFSPDGRALAFLSCTGTLSCSLQVLTLDAALAAGGAPRTVRSNVRTDKPGIAWTRDGGSLVYTSDGYLWRVPAVGDTPPERLELAGSGAFTPAVAAHRDRLAFGLQRDTISQHPLDMTITSPPVLASTGWDILASFSADGQRLVFSSNRGGAGHEIWTAHADGTDARQLTRGPGIAQGAPSFSPDGRQVAFDSRHEDGSTGIFVVDSDGGVPRQLTTDPGSENRPVWSPDGRWIYYTSEQKAGRNVWRIPAAGGRAEQLTTGGAQETVRVSPDGRELLYKAAALPGSGPATPLLAIPLAGGTSRQILPCVQEFTANAIGVYYTTCGPGPKREMHLVEAATRRDSMIGRTRDTGFGGLDTPAVSPDGKTVLTPRGAFTRDLMLIENFK